MTSNISVHNAEQSRDFVTSLSRGLCVIRCFDKNNDRLTLTDVAKRCEFSRATARRFLFTLQDLGYINSDGKLFWLSPKILELGYAYLASQPIVDAVQPYVEQVGNLVGESCSVAVLDGSDIVYVARHFKYHIMSVILNVGTRLPAFVTSTGRAILAYQSADQVNLVLESTEFNQFTSYTVTEISVLRERLNQVRSDGFAMVYEELEYGLTSIAVPIFNQREQVVAAISVSSHSAKVSAEELKKKALPHLVNAAGKIKCALPY